MTLTLVSLFDGIGGFPLAFERAGARTVATVEIDKAAAAVSRKHFPHAHQFSDVTKVNGDGLRAVGFVPDRGIVTAGWPCQVDVMGTLSTGLGIRENGPSYGVNATLRALPGVAHDMVVRRLTELECERLQGYPDGWTDGQSGSARYRQLGNSVAVPVVEWIARRVIAVDEETL